MYRMPGSSGGYASASSLAYPHDSILRIVRISPQLQNLPDMTLIVRRYEQRQLISVDLGVRAIRDELQRFGLYRMIAQTGSGRDELRKRIVVLRQALQGGCPIPLPAGLDRLRRLSLAGTVGDSLHDDLVDHASLVLRRRWGRLEE